MGYSIPRQEQTVLPGIDKEGIPGRDFIPVEWVEACKNPDRSPDIALALHNRGAGYRAEVLRNLELIRRYEAARKTITEK